MSSFIRFIYLKPTQYAHTRRIEMNENERVGLFWSRVIYETFSGVDASAKFRELFFSGGRMCYVHRVHTYVYYVVYIYGVLMHTYISTWNLYVQSHFNLISLSENRSWTL